METSTNIISDIQNSRHEDAPYSLENASKAGKVLDLEDYSNLADKSCRTQNGKEGKRILIAMDSFKGSLTSMQAAAAVEKGVLLANPSFETEILSFADGGEGSAEAMRQDEAAKIRVQAVDALHQEAEAVYYLEKDTAIMDLASIVPITSETRKHPLEADTFGLGLMIKDSLERGVQKLIIAIGGSGSTDGGLGMLQALGWQFFDSENKPAGFGNSALEKITSIKEPSVNLFEKVEVIAACDVKNPLCGPNGAAFVFGPQKGLNPDQVKQADQRLQNWALFAESCLNEKNLMKGQSKESQNTQDQNTEDKNKEDKNKEDKNKENPEIKREIQIRNLQSFSDLPGAGAAGGLGFALFAFLNAKFESGFDLIADRKHLKEKIQAADFVITGEGKLDSSSLMGKGVGAIAALAKSCRPEIPVFVLCGMMDLGFVQLKAAGIAGAWSINACGMSAEESMEPNTASKNLQQAAAVLVNSITVIQSV